MLRCQAPALCRGACTLKARPPPASLGEGGGALEVLLAVLMVSVHGHIYL